MLNMMYDFHKSGAQEEYTTMIPQHLEWMPLATDNLSENEIHIYGHPNEPPPLLRGTVEVKLLFQRKRHTHGQI